MSKTHSCPVHMMYKETKFRYRTFPEDNMKVLELPYNGGGISMVLALPNKDTKLSEVRSQVYPLGLPLL